MDLVARQANGQGRDLQRKGKLNERVAGTDGVLSRKKARRGAHKKIRETGVGGDGLGGGES